MAKRSPVTPAIRVLRSHGVAFKSATYPYVEKGGTRASSAALGVSEHHVIKTLVFETSEREPVIILMHGDCSVSAKAFGRALGVRSVDPMRPEKAQKTTGYSVGGTSPFGTRTACRVFVEASILELDAVWVNGGKRGFLVHLNPMTFTSILNATPVSVARDSS